MKKDYKLDTWLNRLGAIFTTRSDNSLVDDALLPVETQLREALAPFKELDSAAQFHRQRLKTHLHAQLDAMPSRPMHQLRPFLLLAVVLLCVLWLGIIGTGGMARVWESAAHLWHASTSLDQIEGLSITSLSRPRDGIKPLPLLPAILPSNTHASTYGVITDASNPNLLSAFVADYRIDGQDLLVYEQPSDLPLFTAGQTMQIGSLEGQVFQDGQGNHALLWYQHGMMCQITSELPIGQLITIASHFQPITSWEILR